MSDPREPFEPAELPTLVHVLRTRAALQPERLAYTFLLDGEEDEVRITYRDLDRQARAIGALLQSMGAAGQRVLLIYPASLDYVAAFYGCLYAGAVAVPAYPPRPNRPMPRIRAIAADAGALVALTTSAIFSSIEKRIEDLPDLKAIQWRVTDLLSEELAADWRDPGADRGTLAFLQYTSGSTSTPKGVMVSHGNLMHNEELIRRVCEHSGETPCVSWLPLYHDLGLIGNMLQSLYIGTPCTLMSPVSFLQSPIRWLRAISRHRGHTSGGPNFAYELAVAKTTPEQREGLDLSSWRVAFNGAEPVRHDTLERFARTFGRYGFDRRALFPCYGLAETTLIVSGGSPHEPHLSRLYDPAALAGNQAKELQQPGAVGRRLVSSGRPLGDLRVVIAEPETGARLPEGRVGEIWVGGGSVAGGYWDRPEVTAETFDATTRDGEGPYLRTGDLGFLDGGELFITGRLKDLIIIRGSNHYPQDIELTVERSHPALRPGCGAAFAVEIDGEERLVVVQEVERSERSTSVEEIGAAAARAVFEEHELQLFALALIKPGAIPKTTSGKIQRRQSKADYLGGELELLGEWKQGAVSQPAAAARPSEEGLASWLAGRVAAICGLGGVGVDPAKSLLDYGLDSLRAIELLHAVEARTGVSLPLERLFDGPSLTEVVTEIEARRTQAASAPVATAAAAPAADTAASAAASPAAEPLAALSAPAGGGPREFPLSEGQRALWFLHQMDPRSTAYNMANAVRVHSALDLDALRQAFQALVERHPALRTTFVNRHGEPIQRVTPREKARVAFGREDARDWSLGALYRRLEDEAQRPFDLESGPLFKVRVFQRGPEEQILLVVLHHIVGDFWSLALMLRELGALYGMALAGRVPALPDGAPSYERFVAWQREMLASADGEALRSYWRQHLGGELPVLALPTDRPRPPVQTFDGEAVRVEILPELASRLRALAASERVTPFMLMLAGYQALLYRYSGQSELLVGAPAAGRTHASLARAVGYFVNPIVLRARFAPDTTFRQLLAAVRGEVTGAFAHQDYPFPLLVTDLAPDRDPSRSPLFQVMFAFQGAPTHEDAGLAPFAVNEEGARLQVGALDLEHVELPQRMAQFDLTLSVGEVGEGGLLKIGGTLDFNTHLFDRATADRLARNLVVLLDRLASLPEAPLAELPVMSAAERRQVLVDWNDTASELSVEATVQRLIAAQAAKTPEATAVICGEERLTYAELRRRANRLAHLLVESGVGPEHLVGLCAERSPRLLVGLLAILKAGAAYLPLDPASPAERLSYMLSDANADLVLVDPKLRIRWPVGTRLFNLTAAAAGEPNPIPRHAGANNAACVIYTSGSTGAPKGVVIEHGGLVNLVYSFIRSYESGPDDAILPMTSVAYASFTGEVLPVLCSGGTVVLPTAEELLDTKRTTELIARREVTILSAVPSVISNLNAMAAQVPKLRLILSGGDALGAGDIDRLMGTAEVVNGYGLTETTICSTVYWLSRADFLSNLDIPIGKPVINSRLYVLDGRFQPVPVGCSGELFVAGLGLARGFLNHPGKTAERFIPDPFQGGERMYRTGDLARWRGDGNLEFQGRVDHQVKVRGFRIELGEIESVLGRHDRVREAAVLLSADPAAGSSGQRAKDRRLVAFVVFEPGASVSAAELSAWVRQWLPDYMVPASYMTLAALPLNQNGKRDIKALEALAPTTPELERTFTAPRGELERRIATIWQEVLGRPKVGIHDNFFDLGGHSLGLAKVHARVREELGEVTAQLSLVDLFRFPTIAALAGHLAPGETAAAPALRSTPTRTPVAGRDIAVIAVAGRFPGAVTPEQLWANLVGGVESISRFSDEELLAQGVDPELVANPNYIKAKGILGGVDRFDAGLFGFSPRGAELTDPQHRVFLECAWEALERAGYDADRYPGRIGVFAGQSMNTYWLNNLYYHIDLVASLDSLQAAIGNDKDSLTTEVSYRMNLRGPSVLVQSSSSTSLTAVHYAVLSLLAGECDMAITGGVSVHVPEVSGYLYHEGGTTDPSGHCRTFDAEAKGFVSGHGAGAVVLKRLDEALADGDPVLAVIKGSACNNDGSVKVSYMAPSVDGHAEVVAAAQAVAGVSPDSISYIEAHGTGTLLGDPIEVAALTQAFRRGTDKKGFCALGSLKTNIGHLDTAAGVAGLIKTVLCLHHKTLVPILHFENPNPKIDFATSPFFINTELKPWETAGIPRRAGVSSLGMGGTNTHIVLEEAPEAAPSGPSRPHQLLVVSAKTETALATAADNLAAFLAGDGAALPLADVAFTLESGRRAFGHRCAVVAESTAEAARALAERDPQKLLTSAAEATQAVPVFLFSGQGSQYLEMAKGLYEGEPVFRDEVDRCAELLAPRLGLDLRTVLYPKPEAAEAAAERLGCTDLTQPALFVVELALARLLESWGIVPQAMLGHSIGEYVAACLAGVFSLADGLALVAERGRLMASVERGSMLAVPLSEAALKSLLPPGLDIAAINRTDVTVVSGPTTEVATFAAQLASQGIEARQVHTSHAFHSRMMEPILDAFTAAVSRVRLSPPRLPYVSNLSGTWIKPEEATDPAYWARHLRGAVRFAEGLETLLERPGVVLVEVGPGHALKTAAQQVVSELHRRGGAAVPVLSTVRHPRDKAADQAFLLTSVGRLWLAGVPLESAGFWAGQSRRRVVLPTYPFERQRYWVEPGVPEVLKKARASARLSDWLQVPGWRQAPAPGRPEVLLAARAAGCGPWLVLVDDAGPGSAALRRLHDLGCQVVGVRLGSGFARIGPASFQLDPLRSGDWDLLLAELRELGELPRRVVSFWPLSHLEGDLTAEALRRGHESLLGLGRMLGAAGATADITVVTPGFAAVTGQETLQPIWATVLGAVRSLPQELPQLDGRVIDLGGAALDAVDLDRVLAEAVVASTVAEDFVVALRGRRRFVQGFTTLPATEGLTPPLRERGVYLITGGLGGLGLAIAEELARQEQARLVLVGRRMLPPRERWEALLASGALAASSVERLERLLALEALGAELLVMAADVTDRGAMEEVKLRALERFGTVHGVIHAAGVPGGALIELRDREAGQEVLAPKVKGTEVLAQVFADQPLDFLALFSSVTSLLSQLGQADYAAANAYLDAFAQARAGSGHVVALNWDAWREVGMAVTTEVPDELKAWREQSLKNGLSPQEGVAAFRLGLASGLPQLAVSKLPLGEQLRHGYANRAMAVLAESQAKAAEGRQVHSRPLLASPYEAPRTPTEERVAALWEEILGLEQVGIHDNFFELGGNSLVGLKVIARLKAELSAEVSVVSLFDGPTVAALAKILDQALGLGEGEADTVFEDRRSRGARRRERLRQRFED